MYRLTFRFITAVLTFTIGFSLTMIWLFSHHAINRQSLLTIERNQAIIPSASSAELRVKKIAELPHSLGPYKLQFINEREGWLANRTRVWQTTDGGSHWRQILHVNHVNGIHDNCASYKDNKDVEEIENIQLLDLHRGFIKTDFGIYRTDDGGNNWCQLTLPINLQKDFIHTAMFFQDSQHGWLGGAINHRIPLQQWQKHFSTYTHGTTWTFCAYSEAERYFEYVSAIFYTDDGGLTWQQQQLPRTLGAINSVWFTDNQHGFALGLNDIFYTSNRGKSWLRASARNDPSTPALDHIADHAPVGMTMLNSSTGWLIYNDGYLSRSRNGGRSWPELIKPEDDAADGISEPLTLKNTSLYFLNEMHGFKYSTYNSTIYETQDSGHRWRKLYPDVKFDALCFVDAQQMMAVNEQGLFRILPD